MAGHWRGKSLSRREQLERTNAADKFYAAQAGIEPQFQNIVPAKRSRIRRPVDGRPLQASEHQEQCAVITWWAHVHQNYQLPEFALLAIPNGGARDAITGSRLKAEGVRPGALDLVLAKPVGPYSGLWLEMKVGYNKPTDKQWAFIRYLQSAGYKASVHWDSASAISSIKDYLGDELLPCGN